MILLGRLLATVAMVFGSTLAAAFVVPETACAGSGSRAALVVDTGDSALSYCVALPDDSVSGTELIVLAAEQHGLSYRFGYGGDAVCMLAGVGTSGDDCFERYPDFWGYWRGDGSGGWSWSGSGAGSTRVSDGDVEGWSWGSGSDGSSHPAPPGTTFGSVCPAAEPRPSEREPRPAPERRASGGPGAGPERPRTVQPVADPPTRPSSDEGAGREARARPVQRPRIEGKRSPDRAATPAWAETHMTDATEVFDDDVPAVATGTTPASSGPPAAGVAAVIAAGTLGGAGSWIARRRRRERA